LPIIDRGLQFLRGALLSYGPSALRRRVWDKEYRSEKWKFAYNTAGDCVYPHLERFARNGRILDMGCGSGNTATEMANSAYRSYVGVDISEAALEKARKRSLDCGRGDKNTFFCSDFFAYRPSGEFDVILFRESMYHVPIGKVKAILDQYVPYLKDDGVFVIRLFSTALDGVEEKQRPAAMMKIMETEFDVVEKGRYEERGHPVVLVLRPKHMAATIGGDSGDVPSVLEA
jgi:2-polyprenyl-3-methyl-5-hydroxy-6-metoxy-1,4-benzoquinol methylase